MKITLIFFCLTFLFGLFVFTMGPRPVIDTTIHFDREQISKLTPDELESWISNREKLTTNITPGAEEEIVWANSSQKQQTDLAIVYAHGFSATKHEMRPVPDNIAKSSNSNLFFMRFGGHGSGSQALGSQTMNDWINDYMRAIAIGQKLGKKVLVIANSTGAAIATVMAEEKSVAQSIAGYVFTSPNFALKGISIRLLNMPWGEKLLPLFYGENFEWPTHNEAHSKWWTTSYPSKAVFPVGAVLKAAQDTNVSNVAAPLLMICSPEDTVILPKAAEKMAEIWGGESKKVLIKNVEDPSKHIIAGDTFSPSTTDDVVDTVLQWMKTNNL